MDEKKLFLLDAYALIYRAYYAMIRSPRVTSSGMNTSAVFGFCNTLDDVLRKENPGYIAVCFDPPHGKTFRHDAYPEYKANREKQPEDITIAIPYIKRILEAYRIPVIEIPDYEADDVIGTLARRAEAEGYTTYMMTPDKDYGQLVTDRIFQYRPALGGKGFEIRGPREVSEKYGIDSPAQVIDLLALEGDASDNVPGCPKVGEKTAARLIREFGTVENLVENTDRLKGALQRNVSENTEQILFSKFLVTIKTDVPLDIDISSLRRQEPDTGRLMEIYKELEFRSFIAKLTAQEILSGNPSPQPAPERPAMPSLFDLPEPEETTPPDVHAPSAFTAYTTAIAPADISLTVAAAIATASDIGISLYAIGEHAMTASWQGIALSYADATVYIPLSEQPSARAEALAALAPLFTASSVTIVSHDVKRDILLLRREDIRLSASYYDTSVAHYLLKPEMKHHLDSVAPEITGDALSTYTLTDLERRRLATGPDPDAASHTAERAAMVRRLAPLMRTALAEQGQTSLMQEIELPFISVLAAMEWEGVRIDISELARLSVQFTERLERLENEAYALAGEKFNISSPSQVGEILFGKLNIDPKAKKTKRGAWSTTEEILEKYKSAHPIVGIILQVRALKKLLATYVDALPKLINPETGKIHTSFNQTVTATGRISSTNPNLQNIPIRTDDGREIRRAFIPDPGCTMLSADYSQIELRLIADLSADPHMTEAFNSGEDIHRATAARIYHIPIDEVTDNQRRNAKTANFGIIYGISAFGLSQRLDIPRSEAKMLIDGYLASYPRVKEYMDESIEKARDKGYVTTIKGRKRYLPDINSRNATVRGYAERNAINAPLQGSAADIIKIAMIRIHAHIAEAGLRSRMILQVHDELVFNVSPGELETLKQIVITDMEHAYSGRVRLEVAAGAGSNWLEAH